MLRQQLTGVRARIGAGASLQPGSGPIFCLARSGSCLTRPASNLRLISDHRPSANFSVGAITRRFKSSSSSSSSSSTTSTAAPTPQRPNPSKPSAPTALSRTAKKKDGAAPTTKKSPSSSSSAPAAAAAASTPPRRSSSVTEAAAAAAAAESDGRTASLFPPRAEGLKRTLGRPTVYHYPRSRSSYGAIRLLEASSLAPRVIDITSDPLLPRDVERLMGELNIDHPRGLMRVDDPLYAELGLHDETLEREALVQAMLDHPRLMRRPIVEVPYREGGERKRAVIIAQPPQRLFAVLLADESEEDALGMSASTPAEETEADRWAREWSQAEGQYHLNPEQVAELREQLGNDGVNYEFPEETDEMGDDDEPPFMQDDVEAAISDEFDDDEIRRFVREQGLEDEIIIEPEQDHDDGEDDEDEGEGADLQSQAKKTKTKKGLAGPAGYEEEDPELEAKVNAIMMEMARKPFERDGGRATRGRGRKAGRDEDDDVSAEEFGELLERIMELVPPPPRQRSGRRRLPLPPRVTPSSSD